MLSEHRVTLMVGYLNSLLYREDRLEPTIMGTDAAITHFSREGMFDIVQVAQQPCFVSLDYGLRTTSLDVDILWDYLWPTGE